MAQLTVQFTATGQNAVESALKSTQNAFKAVGSAATAPVRALGGFGKALGSIATIAGGAALGAGLAELPGMMVDFAQAAADDEAATSRLHQSLRNLPGDFDAMLGSVNQAIAAGQKLAFTDDEVRDSFQFLASATGSSEEALKRQQAAMDLARGANIPLGQATKMLGKLNEENVEVFKKLGITLGDTATEADALAAVQQKFGGQAATFAESTAGQFEQAKIAMSEIGESIGSALLPAFTAVAKVLADNLPVIQEWVGTFAGGVANLLAPALEKIGPLLQSIFGPLLTTLPDLGTAFQQAFSFFTTGAGDIEKFRGVLTAIVGPEVAQKIIEVFTNLSGFFRETVLPMLDGLVKGWQQVFAGDLPGALKTFLGTMGTYLSDLVENLAKWAAAFIDWVAPMIPDLLRELGALLLRVGEWMVTVALPAILTKLGQWAAAFVEWVAPRIIPLLTALAGLLGELLVWIGTTALPQIVTKLVEWGGAFLGWVGKDVLPKLGDEIKKISDAILTWAGDNITKFGDEAKKWATDMLTKFLTELGLIPQRAFDAIGGAGPDSLKSKLTSAFGDAITAAANKVNELIDNLVEPFRRAWRTIEDLLRKIRGGRSEAEQPAPGGASAQAFGRGGATFYVSNTIDARGMTAAGLTRAVGDDLAYLMRTRLVSGVV